MSAEREINRRDVLDDENNIKSDVYSSSANKSSKKSKSWIGIKFLFLLTLLSAGVATGMHAAGLIDVRPFVWNSAPQIPFIGDYFKEFLNIPESYTLTVAERRKIELQQWQERLDIREKELQEKIAQSELLSNDILLKQQKIDKQEADLLEKEKNRNTKGKETTPEEDALMKELTDTYKEISPRKAAQIITQLPDHLSVELLKKMPQDVRASILARMEPRRAARITENLANPQ